MVDMMIIKVLLKILISYVRSYRSMEYQYWYTSTPVPVLVPSNITVIYFRTQRPETCNRLLLNLTRKLFFFFFLFFLFYTKQTPATILSRFDLIFIVRDIRDEERDRTIARHVLSVHINASRAGGSKRKSNGEFHLI